MQEESRRALTSRVRGIFLTFFHKPFNETVGQVPISAQICYFGKKHVCFLSLIGRRPE